MKKLVTTTTTVDLVDETLTPDGETVNYTEALREVFGCVNDLMCTVEDESSNFELYETLLLDARDVGKADRERMSAAMGDVTGALCDLHECLTETGSRIQGALDVFEGLGAEVASSTALLDMGESLPE